MREKIPGAYSVFNSETGQFYFGSTNDLHRRQNQHARDLEEGVHHNHKLQEAYNENPNFEFIGMPMDTHEEALELEQLVIDEHLGQSECFNISERAFFMSPSEETRKKFREMNKGRVKSPETCAKLSAALKGRPLPAEQKVLQSKIMKERYQDPEFKAKMDEANARRVFTEEGLARSKEAARKNAEATRKSVEVEGVVYPSISAVVNTLGTPHRTVTGRIRSKKEKFKNWKWATDELENQ